MDLVALKREYLAQRGTDAMDSDSDIDVVGDSGAESETFGDNSMFATSVTDTSDNGMDLSSSTHEHDEKSRQRPNPFSIDSLLNNNTWRIANDRLISGSVHSHGCDGHCCVWRV